MIHAIAKLDYKPAIAKIQPFTTDESLPISSAAITAICRLKRDFSQMDQIVALLQNRNVIARRLSIQDLIDANYVAALLNSDNMTVRSSAAKALAQVVICHPDEPLSDEGVQGLKAALQDPNPVVNIVSVMAMGEISAPV